MNSDDVDVLVVGGNPGGCAAAVAAARSGLKVVLLEPTQVLGGMNANGTFGFDCATPQALSGIAEEVAARVRAHYALTGLNDPLHSKREDLVWESHVLAKVWSELLASTPGVRVITRAVAVDVVMDGTRIDKVLWQRAVDPMGNLDAGDAPSQAVRAKLVIDASYEADVTAWAGAPYRLGREARSNLEPHAGKIFFSNQDHSKVGPYLPHSILPGSTGQGDDAIMAFACRLHCRLYEDASPTARHRLRQPPAGYDPSVYRWGPIGTRPDGSPVFFNTLYVLVNGKLLLNRMVHGNNLVGPNREYILAHPRERRALRQQFIDRALGYLYFIQNDGGMPQLGLADDEFQDNGNIPYQIYVREGRRIEARVTLSEAEVNPYVLGDGMRAPHRSDSIAIADWTFESQGCADEPPPGYKYPDGYLIDRVTRAPYQIPYGCLLPVGVDNLIVCGAVSTTHIALGAVRCEAARIQMGIAAGVAAGLALRGAVNPCDVDVDALQAQIVSRGGKLTYFSDVDSSHPDFGAVQWAALRGFVPADPDWAFRPDHPATWGDFVKATVVCLGLPISVTGAHFEGVGRHDDCFRYVESLYDLSSRAGLDLFGLARLRDEDPMKEFLRLFPSHKLLPFNANASLKEPEAVAFLDVVLQALGGSPANPPDDARPRFLLGRAAMCRLLQRVWSRTSSAFAAAGIR